MSTKLIRAWYALTVSFVACAAVAGASVFYASNVQKDAERRAESVRIESDRRWCQLLSDLDGAYNRPQPSTQTGRSVAAEIHRLRTEPQPQGFGCPTQ